MCVGDRERWEERERERTGRSTLCYAMERVGGE
jgi:hypothetical protein